MVNITKVFVLELVLNNVYNVGKRGKHLIRPNLTYLRIGILQQCPLNYYLSYAVAMDFPFLAELNKFLERFQEAGLTKKWKMDIQKEEQQYYTPLVGNESQVLKAYSMDDLWFAFVMLFAGHGAAAALLAAELLWRKWF